MAMCTPRTEPSRKYGELKSNRGKSCHRHRYYLTRRGPENMGESLLCGESGIGRRGRTKRERNAKKEEKKIKREDKKREAEIETRRSKQRQR